MCGIAGLIQSNRNPESPSDVENLLKSIAHRGPDGFGAFRHEAGGVRMDWVHRRLSIIDLSDGGKQPFQDHAGNVLVYNGEIYNYLELREELRGLGHSFSTQTDTEVLLAAYRQWGESLQGMLSRFVGMFAFALWDPKLNELIFARDPFGIKPLYLADTPKGLAFASELKAFWALGMESKVNPASVLPYLKEGLTDHYDGGGAQATFFQGCFQVPPAHFGRVSLKECPKVGDVQFQKYWELPTEPTRNVSFASAADDLRSLFLESVKLHLRSDVPVGAALSGGIDSSAIVMAMRKIAGPELDLHTFSYIASDPSISEEKWVDLVNQEAKAIPHKVWIEESDLARDLESLITAQDEPFGSTSIYAQYRVFREAQKAGIKVMLDGQGADELLGGYKGFLGYRLHDLVRSGNARAMARFSVGGFKRKSPSVRSMWVKAIGAFAPYRPIPRWINRSWFGTDLYNRSRRTLGVKKISLHSVFRSALLDSFSRTSLPMLLRYEDRNSMAHSIESRVPFLVPKIVEYVFSLPDSFLISAGAESKSVFRAALRGIVPDPILNRKDKIGFQTPETSWLPEFFSMYQRTLRVPSHSALPFHPAQVQHQFENPQQVDFRFWRWANVARFLGPL